MNIIKQYRGRIPACGVFCGGCPTYTREKNPCAGAEINSQRCKKCKTFHLCCQDKGLTHCHECDIFPCSKFKSFAKRWLKYGQNFIDNQNLLKEVGEDCFLEYYNSKVENTKKYIVIEKWIESYENPIVLTKGEKLIVDRSIKDSDPEWANWVWCIADSGMDGWVPTQILKIHKAISSEQDIAIALEDYSAYELPVDKDDIVVGSRILNGWLWCRKANSELEGWVPLRNIEPFR